MTPAITTRQIAGIEPEIQNGRMVSSRALWLFLFTFLSGLFSLQAGEMHSLSGHVPPAQAMLQPLDSLAGSNRRAWRIARRLGSQYEAQAPFQRCPC